jgi:uncharacterized protein YigA (DUF484 family)
VNQVISFEQQAVARLRARLGAAEEANEDLIAFARGHSGAVASINQAVLEAIEAPTIDALLHVVTGRWPEILAIDSAAIALVVGSKGFRAEGTTVEQVEPEFVERMIHPLASVEVRSVETGHPLFGVLGRGSIRAEALIRIDGPFPYPHGLLALGQKAELAAGSHHGSALLQFLGQVIASTIRRFVATA